MLYQWAKAARQVETVKFIEHGSDIKNGCHWVPKIGLIHAKYVKLDAAIHPAALAHW